MVKFSAWLAIGYGSILTIAWTWIHLSKWLFPYALVDIGSAALLVAGGYLATKARHLRLLSGAWGFACALAYVSFSGFIQQPLDDVAVLLYSDIEPEFSYAAWVSCVIFVVSVIGLLTSLVGKQQH